MDPEVKIAQTDIKKRGKGEGRERTGRRNERAEKWKGRWERQKRVREKAEK